MITVHRRARVCVAILAVLVVAAAFAFFPSRASARAAESQRVPGANAWMYRFRAAIPQQTYNAIVVSPRFSVNIPSAQFIVRTVAASGTVEDFAFHVRTGETQTINFPEDWTPTGDSILYVTDDVQFSAWGITRNGLMRFEPIERDPDEGIDERERERDLDRFRRERDRNTK